MASLLVVHHTVSERTRAMLDAVLDGARTDEVTGVDVVVVDALDAVTRWDGLREQVLAADGYLIGTTANIGYMSGATKHFFDRVYYEVIDLGHGRPYGLWVHGNNDTTGAVKAVQKVTTGLGWRPFREPVTVIEEPTDADVEALWELGATMAAEFGELA